VAFEYPGQQDRGGQPRPADPGGNSENGIVGVSGFWSSAFEPLFPELIPKDAPARGGTGFIGRFTDYRKGIKAFEPGFDFHAFSPERTS
jgi:hypothetical protein